LVPLSFHQKKDLKMSITNPNSTKTFYDRISSAYDAIADAGEHRARERGLEALAVQPGEQVLEIGFGTGHSLLELAKATGPSGEVRGVDISDGMYQIAQRRLAKAGYEERVQLTVANTPPLPYEDHSFDVVTMSFTLELFPLETIPILLAEVRRVLKPGGRFGTVSMTTTPRGQDDSFLEKTYKWMHAHFPHIVDCQPIEVARLVTDAGLHITKNIEMEIWTMPVAAVVATADTVG
jgi:demethylmenaquinone methyltransferase/2-methoxy-6-polyprenyl-1,4-benzoquinol methylase